jgi:hypothetical protein
MHYGLREHAAIVRRVAREGPALAAHLARLEDPDQRGRLAWYIGRSSMHEQHPALAATYLRLALRAYDELGDRASTAELSEELRRATDDFVPTDQPTPE